jgi:hypothetical protein
LLFARSSKGRDLSHLLLLLFLLLLLLLVI